MSFLAGSFFGDSRTQKAVNIGLMVSQTGAMCLMGAGFLSEAETHHQSMMVWSAFSWMITNGMTCLFNNGKKEEGDVEEQRKPMLSGSPAV